MRKLILATGVVFCLSVSTMAEIKFASQADLSGQQPVGGKPATPSKLDAVDATSIAAIIKDNHVRAACGCGSACGGSGSNLGGDCCAGGGTSGCGCLQPWTSICKTKCDDSCFTSSRLFGGNKADSCCSTGSCGSSCCDSCLRCCDSWSFVGEMLFITRTSADDLTLITDQNTGGQLLNARDFDFDYNAAPRLFIRRDCSNCNGFELGYTGIDSWNDLKLRGNPISPTLIGPGGFPFVSAGPGAVFGAAYGSEFHSAVANFRHRLNECTTVIAGFRMIDFSDTLIAASAAPTAAEYFTIDADNHMYGFQIGFDSELINCGGQFHVDSVLRAGLMFNDADQTTRVPVLAGLPVATNVSASDNHTSFIGELGIRSMYELSSTVSVGAGYHLIWLEGLALAPDQIPVTSLIGGGNAALDTGGGLLFHGAALNATVRY